MSDISEMLRTINSHVHETEREAELKQAKAEAEFNEAKEAVRSLRRRIQELAVVVKELDRAGLQVEKYRGYELHHYDGMYTDYWYHRLGFYKGQEPRIGFMGGGAAGENKFYDPLSDIFYPEDIKYVKYWQRLYEEFAEFESNIYKFVKSLDKGIKEEKVSFIDEEIAEVAFKLSANQVALFSRILYNMRRLLIYLGFEGKVAKLYEKDDIIYLEVDRIYFAYNDGNIMSGAEYNKETLDLVRDFIEKTVGLLVEKVPFKVKGVSFAVSNEELSGGKMADAPNEKGSLNIYLG